MPPQVLANAVCKLESVKLSNYYMGDESPRLRLTLAQLSALCNAILNCDSLRLIELSLINQNLSDIGDLTHLLAKAVCRIPTVDLESTGMSTDQVEVILEEISNQSEIKIHTLYLPDVCVNVSDSILARAAYKLKKLVLYWTSLDGEVVYPPKKNIS